MTSSVSLPISHDNLQCDLQKRATSLGCALLSTAEAVSRVVIGNLALLGYAVTLGHWQEAYTFGAEQLTKAYHASEDSVHHFYAMIWPQQQVRHSPAIPASIPVAKPE